MLWAIADACSLFLSAEAGARAQTSETTEGTQRRTLPPRSLLCPGVAWQVPGVTRISMILSVLSIAMTVKRQYIATVERQWYKEIVRMAGVRRLTTYGGASRWLKFQKRPSAAADVNANASTAQQQLFLAWMQSMGRRQDRRGPRPSRAP